MLPLRCCIILLFKYGVPSYAGFGKESVVLNISYCLASLLQSLPKKKSKEMGFIYLKHIFLEGSWVQMNRKIRGKHDGVLITTDLCRKVCIRLLPFTASTELHALSLF